MSHQWGRKDTLKKQCQRDFRRGPVLKNPPYNAGDVGSIPGQGTKIPHATGQRSPHATTTELMHLNQRACVRQTTEPICSGACAPQLQRPRTLEPARHNQREKTHTQLERSPHAKTKDPACLNEDPTCQKSLRAANCRAHVPWSLRATTRERKPTRHNQTEAREPRGNILHASTKILRAATKT